MKLFEVGGCVRDALLGVDAKDVDFAVVAESFEAMEEGIKADGLKIFLSKEEFGTIRAGVPKSHPLRARCSDADFVLCRVDGPSSDGRRPDWVKPGTILDDLARRDFTVNAIARCVETGALLDPHGGQADLEAKRLRFVGDPMTRIREDGLRVLRGFRFALTKGLTPTFETWKALNSPLAAEMLLSVSADRMLLEVNKMFAFGTLEALAALANISAPVKAAIFRDGLRMAATLKKLK